jgi:hypothetical protein
VAPPAPQALTMRASATATTAGANPAVLARSMVVQVLQLSRTGRKGGCSAVAGFDIEGCLVWLSCYSSVK